MIRRRAKRLDGFSQAHFAGTGSRGAQSRIARSRTGHVRSQAIEPDPEILADVGCRHALPNVLEPLAGLLRRHAGHLLDLTGDGRVDLHRTRHRCPADAAAFAVPVPVTGSAHSTSHAAMTHARAGAVPMLGESSARVEQDGQGQHWYLRAFHPSFLLAFTCLSKPNHWRACGPDGPHQRPQ